MYIIKIISEDNVLYIERLIKR